MACGSTVVQAYRAPLALTVSTVGLAISAVRIVLAVIVCILSRVWQRKCETKHNVQIAANSNGPKSFNSDAHQGPLQRAIAACRANSIGWRVK